jgi:hypothetical protein
MRHAAGILVGILAVIDPGTVVAGQAVPRAEGSEVRAALGGQGYPWYDGQADGVVPLLSDPKSWQRRAGERVDAFFKWLDSFFAGSGKGSSGSGLAGLGNVLTTALFLASGAILLAVLFRLWRTYEPREEDSRGLTPDAGIAARIAGLSEGASLEGIDPWAEALRRRTAGDRAGAVVWLFLGQILELQKRGLLRLIPGRTARQYVLGLEDPGLRADLEASLGVFEEVYYGHRVPTIEALELVWSRAEAVRRRLAADEGRA